MEENNNPIQNLGQENLWLSELEWISKKGCKNIDIASLTIQVSPIEQLPDLSTVQRYNSDEK